MVTLYLFFFNKNALLSVIIFVWSIYHAQQIAARNPLSVQGIKMFEKKIAILKEHDRWQVHLLESSFRNAIASLQKGLDCGQRMIVRMIFVRYISLPPQIQRMRPECSAMVFDVLKIHLLRTFHFQGQLCAITYFQLAILHYLSIPVGFHQVGLQVFGRASAEMEIDIFPKPVFIFLISFTWYQ